MANSADVMDFIQSYKSLNLLWDTSNKNYSNKLLRKEALGELSKQYNFSIPEVKKKIKSLRSYFSKEYQKATKTENYVSAWFAYEAMSFIKDAVHDEDGSPHENNLNNMSFTQPKPAPAITNTSNILRRKKPVVNGNADSQTGEAYGLMGRVADVLTSKDESSSFGEMIAFKLRRLTPRNRAIAQNRIGNMLFELEMEEFQMSTVQSSAVVPNTNSYSESMAQPGTVSVSYATQQSNESSHPDSIYVPDMCKVALNS